MSAVNVGKHSVGSQLSLNIREFIQEKNLYECSECGKAFSVNNSHCTSQNTYRRETFMNAENVIKPSVGSQLSLNIRKVTQEIKPINKVY